MIRHGRKIALPSLLRNRAHPTEAVLTRLVDIPGPHERNDRRSYSTLSDSGYLANRKNVYSTWRADTRYLSTMGGSKQSDDDKENAKKVADSKLDDELNNEKNRIVYYGPGSDKEKDEEKDEQPIEKPKKSRTGMLVSLGIGASFLMGKMKFVLVGLKLTKATPLISMVITSATYSMFFGWTYAIGMVGLIFVHECGHAIVMRYYGVPFSPMVFIPFMGAVISMKERPKNSYEEAIIAFGGPVLGSAAALTVGAAGLATDTQILYALADWGLMINLFNLLPIGSLDGGRICSAVSPSIGVLGLTGGGALIYYGAVHNPIFYLIMMAGTYQTVSRYMGWEEANEEYYKIAPADQASLFAAYLALVAGLLLAMKENDKHRKTPKQLKHESENPYAEEAPWAGNQDGVYDDFFADFAPDADTKWM